MSDEPKPEPTATESLYTMARIYEITDRYTRPTYSRWQRIKRWIHDLLFEDCDGMEW